MNNIFDNINCFERNRHVKSIRQYGDDSLCPNPRISIIMPVYGNPKFFIHSFNSVIFQEVDFSYEIIIVDNTPLDENKSEVLKLVESKNLPFVFYYRNEQNIGMTGNWNRGIELARADLLTFCHDDDMLFPDCLEKLWKAHLDYPDIFVIPKQQVIDETITYPLSNAKTVEYNKKDCISFDQIDIYMGNPTNGVGCLFYKQHLLEMGGYNDEYYPSMDNALHIKYIFEYGAIRYNNELYGYRISKNNESNNVYKGFIENGLFYGLCMKPYMKVSPFVLRLLDHAYKTRMISIMEKVWGKKREVTLKPTITDRIVMKILKCRTYLKSKRMLGWK